MGGNLFDCRRLTNLELKRVEQEIEHSLRLLGTRASVPDSIKNKETHGDVDFICSYPVLSDEKLKSAFGSDLQIHRNTDTVSMFYENKYQVDLNFHPSEDFESAFNYNRGSDAGNLIGVLYSRLGFSYGHKGLRYYVNLSKEDSLGAVLISKDQKKILDFIDLDYNKWLNGFESQEDLYEWVIKSKFFSKEFYKYENLNHINKVRQKKRPVYRDFLDYLESREIINNYVVGDKSDFIWKAALHFNCNWFESATILINERKRKIAVRDIFSGADLLELGYSGPQLGAALSKFRNRYEYFDSFVLSHTKEEMIEEFRKFENEQ